MGGPLVNVTKDGNTVAVPADEEGPLLQRGYVEETPEQHAARVQADIDASNDPGALSAGVMAGLSGLTLGGTDALIAAEGGQSQLHDLYADHPIARTAGNIIGGIAPAALGDVAGVGDLLARTPAGFTMGIGSKIADALGGGALGMTAAGAFEGAANNAGGYVSDVVLGDRDLSAEGFLGAMGKGALYGGVAAGVLASAGHGLIAARRLIPAAEITPDAVAEAQQAATNAVRDSVDTSTRPHAGGAGPGCEHEPRNAAASPGSRPGADERARRACTAVRGRGLAAAYDDGSAEHRDTSRAGADRGPRSPASADSRRHPSRQGPRRGRAVHARGDGSGGRS